MSENVITEKIAEFDKKINIVKYRILMSAEEWKEEQDKLKPIYDEFKDDHRRYIQEITNVKDKYQIVRVKHKRKGEPAEILYHVYVEFKRTNTCTYAFDEALVEAIAIYHNCGQAAQWIGRMLNFRFQPEFEE